MLARSAKAYSPSHITGFFEIIRHESPLRMGSVGCGIALKAGCIVEVRLSDEREHCIRINGVEAEASTTKLVVERLAGKPVVVDIKLDVPVGCGFGASAAGTLSTALALNELFSLKMSLNRLAQLAHVAEVTNRTGLGDVIAQSYGGAVIRLSPGPPGIGVIDKIPCGNVEIGAVTFGKLPTRSILEDEGAMRRINEAGRKAMRDFMQAPSLENFMRTSKRFAYETELISERGMDAIEAVEAEGGLASVAMLGDTVFAVGLAGDGRKISYTLPENIYERLSDFGAVIKSKIATHGAKVLP
ncbi:MAG: Archaeal pantoate kinase [Candidatus Alkanophagales archaeon MCA70_species_1]|nr:Archaeal pantoate kinase [Candidatus Alkanophaga volatiphilum]